MCVQCKTPLNLSTAAVAEREREFIRSEIARGKSKDEIKAGLVERFGPAAGGPGRVFGRPPTSSPWPRRAGRRCRRMLGCAVARPAAPRGRAPSRMPDARRSTRPERAAPGS